MKLLLDVNPTYRLPNILKDIFPDSVHVRDAGLEHASDDAVREMDRAREGVIKQYQAACGSILVLAFSLALPSA